MPGGFAPRFAVEAGFLILLGVGAGVADLGPAVIVALLAGGWVLASLIELAVWRSQAAPVATSIPPPVRVEEPAWAGDDEPHVEVEKPGYPLRVDAGAAPSGEVEEYTRVLGSRPEDTRTGEAAE